MTTRFREEVVCGACGAKSEQIVIGSTNRFGAPDLDLRPPPMQRDTIDTWIRECPKCAYLAYDLTGVDEDAAAIVKAEGWKPLGRKAGAVAARFRRRALIDERLGNVKAAGDAALWAAWASDDDEDDQAASADRLRSAALFGRWLEGSSTDDDEARGAMVRRVDALRRAGAWAEAGGAAEAALASPAATGFVRDVLRFESDLIRRRDRAAHTLDEIADKQERTAP